MSDYQTPMEPFVDTWVIRCTFEARELSNDKLVSVRNIRRYLYRQLDLERVRNSDLPDYAFHDYLHELVSEHLNGSNFPFFVTDYRETEGSFAVSIQVAAVVVDGISGFGAFTAGLVAIHQSLQLIETHAPRLKVFVERKRGKPKRIAKARIEPSLYPEHDSDTPDPR